jgi:hypothetical protein
MRPKEASMLAGLRHRLTYANVMATVAVFIALGGGAYAATRLPANSVGSRQLKKKAVTPSKVAPATVTLFRGQKGDQGPPGPKGDTGSQGIQGIQGSTGPSNAYFSSSTGGAALSLPAGDYVVLGQCAFSNTNSGGVFTGLDSLVSSELGDVGSASATLPASGSGEAVRNIAVHLTRAGTIDNGCTSGSGVSVASNTLTAIKVGTVTP